MSTVLREIDQALASYAAQHHARPVVVYLGERKLTQLILEVAQLSEQPALRAAGPEYVGGPARGLPQPRHPVR